MRFLFVLLISFFSINASAQWMTPEFKCSHAYASYSKQKNNDKKSSAYIDTRSDSIDITKYTINLTITDFVGKKIKGHTQIDFTSKVGFVNKLRFDLLQLAIDSIVYQNQQLTYIYNDTLIIINLPSPLTIGQNKSIKIYYQGTPKIDASNWGGFYFQSNYAYNLGVGFDANPHNFGRVWFPCFDNFVERSLYDFNITTQATHKAFCGGVLTNTVTNPDGTKTWSWKLNQKIPTYLASVAVSTYATVNQSFLSTSGLTIPIQLGAVPADTTNVKNSFIHLKDALNGFESSYGPYKWDRVGYVMVPFSSGAMEHACNIAYPRSMANGSLTYETLMAHELSHHWWGNLITCESAADMWINEGMASYSEQRFLEVVYGRTRYLDELRKNLTEVLHYAHFREGGYRAISGIPHEYTYGDHVYKKGAVVAHNLRAYMGDANFLAGVTSLMSTYSFKDINSAKMRDHLTFNSGVNLNEFFDDWVFNPGFPHFSVYHYSALPAGNSYYVTYVVKQKLTGTDKLFKNVPIEVTFRGAQFQTQTVKVTTNGIYKTFTIVLPFNPVFAACNVNQFINDAISSEAKSIKTAGAHSFSIAFINLNVTTVGGDSAYVRVEHNWTKPEIFINQQPYRLSPNRYWTVDGVKPTNFAAKATITYDGRNITSGGTGSFDNDLITVTEDSLVLLYRPISSHAVANQIDWVEFPRYTKTMGVKTDKTGTISIDSLAFGEYALAIKDYTQMIGVGEKEIQYKDSVVISPNPADQTISIRFLGGIKVKKYTITDTNGKVYMYGGQNHTFDELTTAKWPTGTYIFQLYTTENKYINKKIIIVH